MRLKTNNRGVVSFFTVIFLSVLLLVITTAFIRLMINSQRLATDNDLSTRAYYAAEAGVDDALVKLKQLAKDDPDGELSESDIRGAFGSGCGSGAELDDQYDISYTCQFVSSLSADSNPDDVPYEFELAKDKFENVDLHGTDGVDAVEISWHNKSEGDGALIDSGLSVGDNRSDWSGLPAIIRLQTVQYPSSGPITSFTNNNSTISNDISFAYPINTNLSGAAEINIGSSTGAGRCDYSSDEGYVCSVRFTNFSDNKYAFLRVRAVNAAANVKVVPLDEDGEPLSVPGQVAIDVTGRANDVYRRIRVQATLPNRETNTSGGETWEINHALLTDETICKELEVNPTDGTIIAPGCL